MAKRQVGRKRKQPKVLVKVQVYGHQGYQPGMGGVVTIRLREEPSQKQVVGLLDAIEARAGAWLTDNSLD